MTIINKQAEWLLKLKRLTDRGILVAKNVGDHPGRWYPSSQARYPIDYRTVLPSELVFDVDAKDIKNAKRATECLIKYLSNNNTPFILADSGGKGFHIHVFYEIKRDDRLKELLDEIKARDECKLLRELLFDYILEKAIPKEESHLKEFFDRSPVRWSIERKGALIREFGGEKIDGENRYYKTVITKLPDKQKRRIKKVEDVKFPSELKIWTVPKELILKLLEKHAKVVEKRREKEEPVSIEDFPYGGDYLKLPCVKKILNGMEEGRRNKGAIAVAIASKLDGKSKTEIKAILEDYRERCKELSHPLTSEEIEYIVNWTKGVREWWLCKFVQEFNACDKSSCELIAKFKQKRSIEAKKLFDENWRKVEEFLRQKKYPERFIEGLKAHYCVVYSLKLREYGELVLWLWYVDEPSGLKTWLMKLMKDAKVSYFVDEVTRASFIVGKVDEKTGRAYDLLPKLNGRVLYSADLTPLFSMHHEKLGEILGVYTRLYDGEGYKRVTGARGVVCYEDVQFAWIGGLTNIAIEEKKRVIQKMGQRVLFYRFDYTDEQVWEMRRNKPTKKEISTLQNLCSKLCDLCIEIEPHLYFNEEETEWVWLVAELLRKCRAIVRLRKEWIVPDEDFEGDKPRLREYLAVEQVEYPLRAEEQIMSLVMSYMTLFNANFKEAIAFATKVAVYSAPPNRSRTLQLFFEKDKVGFSDVKRRIGMSDKGVSLMLSELALLELIEKSEESWRVKKKFKKLFDHVKEITFAYRALTKQTWQTSNYQAVDFKPLESTGICELCGENGANIRIILSDGSKIIAHATCAFDDFPKLQEKGGVKKE